MSPRSQWQKVLKEYCPNDVTEAQFINDFCSCFSWGNDIRTELSRGLHWAFPRFDGIDIGAIHAFLDSTLRYQKITSITQPVVRPLLESVETITFQKGEDVMMKYLSQQDHDVWEQRDWLKMSNRPQGFDTKARDLLDTSGIWYKLSPSAYERLWFHTRKRLRKVVSQVAQAQISEMDLAEHGSGSWYVNKGLEPYQDRSRPITRPIQDIQESSFSASAKIADAVKCKLREEHGIDLTFPKEWLTLERAKMLQAVNKHYDDEISVILCKGQLPKRTPQAHQKDNVLTSLVSKVRHVYTNKKGALGQHEAFVRQIFRMRFGSLLVTGTQNSFDHYLGSAFELIDMILSQILPVHIPLEFPIEGNNWMRRYTSLGSSLSTYRALCLSSKRMREFVHSSLMKRVELQVDLSKTGFNEAIIRALKKLWPLPYHYYGGVSKQNIFALIPHIKLSLDMGSRPKSSRQRLPHKHIPTLLRMMSGLARLQLDIPLDLQHLAFSDRGQPASWLVDAILSIPVRANVELYIDGYSVQDIGGTQPLAAANHASMTNSLDDDTIDDFEMKSYIRKLSDGHLYPVLRAFLEVSQRLIKKDPSTDSLREVNGEEEKAKNKVHPSAVIFVSDRFYIMMSQVLRERGKSGAANWFEAIKSETIINEKYVMVD